MSIGNYQWKEQRVHLKDNPELQKKWLNTILKIKANSSRECFINIKVHFPRNTYDYLNDLPPVVDKIAVK